MKNEPLLSVKDLKKYFPTKKGFFQREGRYVKAVDGVNFEIYTGETFGLVGESGCGKSTVGRSILRLIEPTSGEVLFNGQNILNLSHKEMRNMYRNMQLIFQDPYASLNPRMTVGQLIMEPMIVHNMYTEAERKKKVDELLEVVGLDAFYASRYPHEFSGGQRQRVGIARALVLNPKLIIADEPVSALDVSIQSQVLNLLKQLQLDYNIAYLFISHNLSVVKHVSNRIGVMYLGRIVESGNKEQIYSQTLHPYSKALLSAIPVADPEAKNNRIILQGDVPSPANPPAGCAFHTRCASCMEICRKERPVSKDVGDGHKVACHLYD